MKQVVLSKSPHITSNLGFGTSALIGSNSRAESLRILETAYDTGIRHYDTAPLYGSGDAEIVLGEFAQKYREQITITTKFGLRPMAATSPATQSLKSVLRKVMRFTPKLKEWLRRYSGKTITKSIYSKESLQASLDQSLQKLNTDYIDCFLLHDCGVSDATPEVLEFLETAVKAGKILTFGVGTSFAIIQELAQTQPNLLPVMQFANNLCLRNAELLLQSPQKSLLEQGSIMITHSPIGDCLKRLRDYWHRHPQQKQIWQNTLELDLEQNQIVVALLMSYAVASNPDGIVLFSSNCPHNIGQNIRNLWEPPFAPAQLAGFTAMTAEVTDRAS